MKRKERLGWAAFIVSVSIGSALWYSWAETRCDLACLESAREAELHFNAISTTCWCFDRDGRAYRP